MHKDEVLTYVLIEGKAPAGQFAKAHDADAGYDLKSAVDAVVPAGGRAVIDTGLMVAVPAGFAGIVKSRSGTAVKHGLEAGAGVIDSGYRGEVKVLLHNFGTEEFAVRKGDRIAQMCIVRLHAGECVRVACLDITDRGTGGFGSTGK